MKRKIKIEIPIVLITIVMLGLLLYSGNLVYRSLSEIVGSMLGEARPDYKLIMVKDLSSDLSEVESSVRLYTLSEKRDYLQKYNELRGAIPGRIDELQNYALADSSVAGSIDSLAVLAGQKLEIWQNVLNLHLSRKSGQSSVSQYFEELEPDTSIVVQDTIRFEPAEQRGLLKRIFGKKPEPPAPIIVDRTAERTAVRDSIRQEIAALEKQIADRNRAITSREAALMQKNLEVSNALAGLIEKMERREQQNLVTKTQDADRLASETYKRLALFALTVILLMLLILFLFFRDLRKARIYQRALREAKQEAENLARTKELFVATVSHEMRTPVNAIYGLTEQLLQTRHDAKTRKDLEVVHQSTRHLIELVNDTFDFTRIEKQRLQLRPVDFQLDDLLSKVELFNHESARAKSLNFTVDRGNTNGLVLFGDEGRLKQILNNLLTNAIKFTDRGGVTLKVNAEFSDENIELAFVVSDTGIGIPGEHIDTIFNDFVQLETDANKKSGGTGLGLYIVKKLIDLLGGEIRVESEPGNGTTFLVRMPMKRGNPANIQNAFESLPAPGKLKGEKVLIVDDEEFNRHLLKNILGKWEIELAEAENGKQALEKAEKDYFGLVLMDVRMPEMNGIDAAREFKKMKHPAKIIGLSANTDPNEKEAYLENGFDNFLEKPFNEAALHRVISDTLENSSPAKIKMGEETLNFHPHLHDLENMANGDRIFMREMIEIFMASSEKSIAAIAQNLADENWQAIGDLAHKLAAPVKHMNLTGIHRSVKELQKLAENDPDKKMIGTKFKQVKKEINLLNRQLTEFLKNI